MVSPSTPRSSNAQRSTGPRTLAGKATTRLNALKHGLLSRQPLLPDENRTEFDEFAELLGQAVSPETAHQVLLDMYANRDLPVDIRVSAAHARNA